jgi:hypothetical protein
MTFIGIDVSQKQFDTAFLAGKGYQSSKFIHELAGFQAFHAQLPWDAHCLMEARGPYYLG